MFVEGTKMIRIVLKEASQTNKIIYHTGQKLIGGNLSLDYLRSGEGGNSLGPGIYFSDQKENSLMYSGYHDEPYLYVAELLNPERIAKPTTPMGDAGSWKELAEKHELKKAIEIAKKEGWSGVYHDDGHASEYGGEYCIFDFSVLKIVKIINAGGPKHQKLRRQIKYEKERENHKCSKCNELLWNLHDYSLTPTDMQEIRRWHNERRHPIARIDPRVSRCKKCLERIWSPSEELNQEEMIERILDHRVFCKEKDAPNSDGWPEDLEMFQEVLKEKKVLSEMNLDKDPKNRPIKWWEKIALILADKLHAMESAGIDAKDAFEIIDGIAGLLLNESLDDEEIAQLGTKKKTYDYVTKDEYEKLRPYLLQRSQKRNKLLNPELTAYTPGETLELLTKNQTIIGWLEKMKKFKVPSGYDTVVLVGCAATKPWGMNQKRGEFYPFYNAIRRDVKAGKMKPVYFVTISEPLGIVPEDSWGDNLENMFPQYDNPGLFDDSMKRSGMMTKDWAKSPIGQKKELPFGKQSFDKSINILGDVIGEFIKNNSDKKFVSFVELADGTKSTHSMMLDRAEKVSGVKIPRHTKKEEVGRKKGEARDVGRMMRSRLEQD